MQNFKEIYQEWLNSSLLTKEEKDELLALKQNEKEIELRFFQNLAFGTGGLRGVMQMGTNCMNRFVVKKATQGLTNYLLNQYKSPTVCIGYDSRNNSSLFAKETAATLAANGIKVFIYPELMPTPSLSFAVRYFKAQAGIVVTASHNPKQYNGYKVYGDDGCQITGSMANAILEEINHLDIFKDVKQGDFDKDLANKNIEYIKQDTVDAYLKSDLNQSIYKENKVLNIFYTPLNGSGRKCVTSILAMDGFKNVHVIKEQENPDGNFPTCPYPNPEIHEALAIGIDQLIKNNGDILIGTDPDSDRLGVVVNNNGTPRILTGNEVGLLLFDAIYHARKENGTLTKRPVLVKTIVSTDMANVMAKDLGVEVRDVLTGFKYIGEQIHLLEEENNIKDYLLGFEESCGYLTNTDIRDKDAVNAALLLAEIANHYKLEGKTLIDRLNDLYKKYGDFKTHTLVFEFPGVEGMEQMKNIMLKFRKEEVIKQIGEVLYYADYKKGVIVKDNKTTPTGLPVSDVMKYFLTKDETITIRPSGTEPKLKVYLFANGQDSLENLKIKLTKLVKE